MNARVQQRTETTRPGTTQEYVLASLREMILSGELPAGTPIRQEDAALRLGVSRPPVREALQILQNEGHVTYAPYRGFTVVQRSLEELREIYELRTLLESEAIRQSVPRYDEELFSELSELQDQIALLAEKSDLTAMQQHNRSFHFRLMEPCGKERLLAMIGQLWDATNVYRSVYYADPVARDRVSREHAHIIDLATTRSTDRLIVALNEHRDHMLGVLQVLTDEVGRSRTDRSAR